jgi:hypothetical protein
VYEELIGEPRQARNTNAGEPMEMLVVQISNEREPLMYKAESPGPRRQLFPLPSQHTQDSPGNIHHN